MISVFNEMGYFVNIKSGAIALCDGRFGQICSVPTS